MWTLKKLKLLFFPFLHFFCECLYFIFHPKWSKLGTECFHFFFFLKEKYDRVESFVNLEHLVWLKMR